MDESYNLKKPLNKMSKKEQLLAKQRPDFLVNRLDKNGKKPNDINFDHTSVLISQSQFEKLSEGMKRFWELKKDNMDKILLFRFGDWYVTYYDDL